MVSPEGTGSDIGKSDNDNTNKPRPGQFAAALEWMHAASQIQSVEPSRKCAIANGLHRVRYLHDGKDLGSLA